MTKILIVEDEPAMVSGLRDNFEYEGYQVITAPDGVAGLAIVLAHNVWVPNWRVLITLLGWLMLVRGAARILFTDRVMEFAKTVVRNKRIYPISGAVVGVLGLVLCYFGYLA